jgi:hypothetical protein
VIVAAAVEVTAAVKAVEVIIILLRIIIIIGIKINRPRNGLKPIPKEI